jgi:hypothetical protein
VRDVLVAVPTRGTVTWQTAQRLGEIRDAHPGLPPILWQPGNLSVARTRNLIVRRFLATDATTLVMVDDDVVPPPRTLEWITPVPDGFGAVAIPHPMPHPSRPGHLVLTAMQRHPHGDLIPAGIRTAGLMQVQAVATGCVSIPRAVLEALGPNPFRIPDDPDEDPASDDFIFCADLIAAGLKVGAYIPPGGWFCDHVSTVGLAPLYEQEARARA